LLRIRSALKDGNAKGAFSASAWPDFDEEIPSGLLALLPIFHIPAGRPPRGAQKSTFVQTNIVAWPAFNREYPAADRQSPSHRRAASTKVALASTLGSPVRQFLRDPRRIGSGLHLAL